MKGYKYKIYVKQGIKESRKHYKSIWNRRIRHNDNIVYNNCSYKKLAGYSIYKYVS